MFGSQGLASELLVVKWKRRLLGKSPMTRIEGVLETSLYVTDVESSKSFYQNVLGLEQIESGIGICALRIGGQQVLLLCEKGVHANLKISGHDGQGRLHLALAVPPADLAEWEVRLTSLGIDIEERKVWRLGGQSLYFRDPDQHLIELASPRTWDIY